MTTTEKLTQLYDTLFAHFGPQHWWPGQTRFEIIIGAILTQNTNWSNVQKAITQLKASNVLAPDRLRDMEPDRLAQLIRPAGYFRVKAKRIGHYLDWLFARFAGDLDRVAKLNTYSLREELLSISGIGPETADSMLLYAFNRPIFVVDTYTARVAVRHGLIEPPFDYHQLQDLFESNLPQDAKLYNEYHALIVAIGKEFCKPTARCEPCPLNALPHTAELPLA